MLKFKTEFIHNVNANRWNIYIRCYQLFNILSNYKSDTFSSNIKSFGRKRIDNILEEIEKKDVLKRYSLRALGCLIVAFSFNLFFLRYNIVCFGVSGISIVLSEFGVNPSIFIMGANLFLIVIVF